MPTDEDVMLWARHLGADESLVERLLEQLAEAQAIHRDWKQQIRLGQAAIQHNYDDLAQRARVIRNVELTVIPGLLQTPEYAAERIAESARTHGAKVEEIPAAIAARIQRQQILYDSTKNFQFVITEAVLNFLLCTPTAMLAQLDRLLSLTAGMPNIELGVIPFGVPLAIAPQNGFILFDDLAVVETHIGETIHHGEEAAAYTSAMDLLFSEACTGEQARLLILKAAHRFRTANAPNTDLR